MHIAKIIGLIATALALSSCKFGVDIQSKGTTGTGKLLANGGIIGNATHYNINTIHVADMDGDGKPDIVYTQGNTIFMLKNMGDGNFARVPMHDVTK